MSAELKQEFASLVKNLKETVDTSTGKLEVKYQEQFDKVNEKLDQFELELKKNVKVDPKVKTSEDVKSFEQAFRSFVKKDGSIREFGEKKYQTKSSNMVRFDLASAGALVLPPEFGAEIFRNVVENTPVAELVRVTPTDRSDFKRRVRTSTGGGTWLAEDATNSKVKNEYKLVSMPPHKWAAQYGVSIEELEDSAYSIANEITEAFVEDAAAGIGTAVVTGDGVGKPQGMIGNITNFNSASLALTSDLLIELQSQIKDSYQTNASWLFTRKTRAYIRSLVLSSTNGLEYTWEPNFQAGMPAILLGNPVYIANDTDLASLASGNFTATDVPIIYGDFARGYEMTRSTNMYMIEDRYSEASTFTTNYHIMSRIGGAVTLDEALVQLTITAP